MGDIYPPFDRARRTLSEKKKRVSSRRIWSEKTSKNSISTLSRITHVAVIWARFGTDKKSKNPSSLQDWPGTKLDRKMPQAESRPRLLPGLSGHRSGLVSFPHVLGPPGKQRGTSWTQNRAITKIMKITKNGGIHTGFSEHRIMFFSPK